MWISWDYKVLIETETLQCFNCGLVNFESVYNCNLINYFMILLEILNSESLEPYFNISKVY